MPKATGLPGGPTKGKAPKRLPPVPASPGQALHPEHFNTHVLAPPTPQRSTPPPTTSHPEVAGPRASESSVPSIRHEAAARRAEVKQQHLVDKFVTKAYENKVSKIRGTTPLSPAGVGDRIEQAKHEVSSLRNRLLNHPAVKSANEEGKIVPPKGLQKLRTAEPKFKGAVLHPGSETKGGGVGGAVKSVVREAEGIGRYATGHGPIPTGPVSPNNPIAKSIKGDISTLAHRAKRHYEIGKPETPREQIPTAKEDLAAADIASNLAGVKGGASVGETIGSLATKEGLAGAGESIAAKAAHLREMPSSIAESIKNLPTAAREAPQAAKAGLKELPAASRAAVKAAPSAAARGAASGAQKAYHATGALAVAGTAHKAGLNIPGGTILEGQERAIAHNPLKVAQSTANLAPSLLVSTFQLPAAAIKSGVEGNTAPLTGALNEQKNFFKNFAETYGSNNPKKIEQATLKEGLLPEVLLAPLAAKGVGLANEKFGLYDKALKASKERRAPLTDEAGNVLTHEHGGPVRRGTQRHPNEIRLTRGAENRHLRREEARHFSTAEDVTKNEFASRIAPMDKAAHKAAGERVPIRENLGPKGNETLHARSPDFIPFLARAGIDLHNPDAALREIQHYAEHFKNLPPTAQYGVHPEELTARDAVRYFSEHPGELQNPHLAKALDAYRSMANGETGHPSLSTSERNRYLGAAVMHGITLPEDRVPLAARAFTKATTRAGAEKDLAALDKQIGDLAKSAREKRIEAKGAGDGARGARLRREAKEAAAKRKTLQATREEFHAALTKVPGTNLEFKRAGASSNPRAKRIGYDTALENEMVNETRAMLKERGLHPEPAYVPDQSVVRRATPDQSVTGGQKPLPKGPQVNEGFVWEHGLARQGYEHLRMNGVFRSIAAHHQFEDMRRFRNDRGIEIGGSRRLNGKGWATAQAHGLINPKDTVLVPTQVLNRLEKSMQGGDPTEYQTAFAALTAESVPATEAHAGTIYEAFPKAAYQERVAQAQKSPINNGLRTANMVTSRAMLSTPSFIGAQIVAETAQAVADVNPVRMLQGLRAYNRLSPQEKAHISGVSGETAGSIFSVGKMDTALGATDSRPLKDALGFFRRNVVGRSAKSVVTMKWAGEINRATSGFTRRAVLTGDVMRELNGMWAHGRKLLGAQTELQKGLAEATKGLRGKAKRDAALRFVEQNPKLLNEVQRGLHGAMGGWDNLTRTGHFPETYRAAALVFYPFLRFSLLWPLKFARDHPLKATALTYLAAQNNFALREALHGEPSFLNYAQIPLYGYGKGGKIEPVSTVNLSRMSPGGNALVSAIQGSGTPAGALQPVVGAGLAGAFGVGSLGPIEGGTGAHLKAGAAQILNLSPYIRAADTLRGQKASGESEFGILAKRANIAVEPLAALEAKLKGPVGEQLFRSLGNPLQPQNIERQRDYTKLSRVLKTLSETSTDKRNKIEGFTAKERSQIKSMEKRSEKASEELKALYKKYGLTKAAAADEAIWKFAHPVGGSESGSIYNKKSLYEQKSIYEGSSIYGGGKAPKVPHETNGITLPHISIPGLGAVTGFLGNLAGGTPAQAATLPKGRQGNAQKAQPPSYATLTPSQARIAQTILQTGHEMGANKKELLAAVETGLVESNLSNPAGGTGTSQGWRQETASSYPNVNRRNVKAGAERYFRETREAGGGKGMTAGQLAQSVQRSAYPERYDKRKGEAVPVLRDFLGGAIAKPSPYTNPFPANQWETERTDMGKDFGPKRQGAPILSIGKAKVLKTGAPGWPGGGGVLYKLLNGPQKGKVIYNYESVNPTVRPGQVVKKGQIIGRGWTGGTGVEAGYGTRTGEAVAAPEYHEGMETRAGKAFAGFLKKLAGGAPVGPGVVIPGSGSSASYTVPGVQVAAYSNVTGKSQAQVKKELKAKKLSPLQMLKRIETLTGSVVSPFSARPASQIGPSASDLQAIAESVSAARRKLTVG